MRSAVFSLALAAGALASPMDMIEKRKAAPCINDVEAQRFMGRFTSILQHTSSDLGDYVTTANKLLTEDFQEISDSINMLANKPLGSVTADKAAYIKGAQNSPGASGIENVFVKSFNCKQILWEWNMVGIGKATYPVKGYAVFKVGRTGEKGRIQASELKLEFNSIAWGLNTGYGWVKQDGTLLGRAPNPTPVTTPAPAEPAVEETPAEEAPVSEAPVTEAPVTDAPKTETPATENTGTTETTVTETSGGSK